MAKRVDGVIDELRELGGNILLFGHDYCFRSIAARFLNLSIRFATNLRLDAGTISILLDDRDGSALVLWNRRGPASRDGRGRHRHRDRSHVPLAARARMPPWDACSHSSPSSRRGSS
jgi:broad specificity phosphatase PhoE